MLVDDDAGTAEDDLDVAGRPGAFELLARLAVDDHVRHVHVVVPPFAVGRGTFTPSIFTATSSGDGGFIPLRSNVQLMTIPVIWANAAASSADELAA